MMSIGAQKFNLYQQNAIQTATKEQLVLLLYDGALKFLGQARSALAEGQLEKSHQALVRAQEIIYELMNGVDRQAGEVGENLFLLYDYMYRRLIDANVHKETGPAEEVEAMIKELKDAWLEAVKKVKSKSASNYA